MKTALFNGVTLAESDATVVVEGNHYFPPDSIRWEHFARTEHHTRCPWKGDAAYYTISAGGQIEENAAWTYEAPLDAATEIKDHVAFYPSVTVA
jgi:uncharacterized protein (DUF427 family)